MLKVSKFDILRDYVQLRNFLPRYLLNPFENIKRPPVLHWQSSVLFLVALNVVYGIIQGIYSFDILQFLIVTIVTPIMAASVLLLVSVFLYYFFQYMFNETHHFSHLVTVLLLAYLPASLFFLGSVFYAPIYLLGLLVMSVLVVRGLIENFKIPKNTVVSLVTIGFLLALVFWIVNELYGYRAPVKPKSLDQLETEIGNF